MAESAKTSIADPIGYREVIAIWIGKGRAPHGHLLTPLRQCKSFPIGGDTLFTGPIVADPFRGNILQVLTLSRSEIREQVLYPSGEYR